ncbi:MAG TPA: head GIN domain-containing protein [Terriglobia bacterium]|jgi:hypothetical protein
MPILLIGFCAVLTAGCGLSGIRGSGNVVSEPRDVSGFTEVKLNGTGQLTIDQTGTESLTITADDNLLPYLTSEVSGSQLTLGTKDQTGISPSKDVVYKLTVKDLNNITVAGSGSADAKGIHTGRLKMLVAGSGSLSAAGAADVQEVTIAGSGAYRGSSLKSKTATISIMGSGNAELDASETLDANITGSGDIRYSGAPAITKQIIGSGSVEKR